MKKAIALNRRDHRPCTEHHHGAARVNGHHRAEGKSGSEHQRERFGADLRELPRDLLRLKWRLKQINDYTQPELADFPDELNELDQSIQLSSCNRRHLSYTGAGHRIFGIVALSRTCK